MANSAKTIATAPANERIKGSGVACNRLTAATLTATVGAEAGSDDVFSDELF
jgi:hypothetical protein